MEHTLPFPNERPPSYIKLENEPVFDAKKHLALGQAETCLSLEQLGYTKDEIANCPTSFGLTTAFRILSPEGVKVMRDTCKAMYDNRNVSVGTGINRLGSYVRGAGYRSKFIKDFCESPELAEHLSKMAGVSLARHSVPAVACGVNYAPKDIRKAVDSWHVDSVAFDVVMMVSDPHMLEGGEFQYFHGTKMEGQKLLGIEGEEGVDTELPLERVVTIPFPDAGYGFMQHGNMIFHRACRLKKKAERITMIPSFVVTPAEANDATNSVNMASWDDPGLSAELTRHEAWRASARLHSLIDSVSLHDDNESLTTQIDTALEPLLAFRNRIANPKK